MVTFWYVVLWLQALGAALLIGLGSHYCHSHLQAYPDKLFDGGGFSDTILNEMMSPEHRVHGHYDQGGWWEFYSWRNYATHALPLVFIVVVTGLLNWEDRAGALKWVCDGVAPVGLTPAFCP